MTPFLAKKLAKKLTRFLTAIWHDERGEVQVADAEPADPPADAPASDPPAPADDEPKPITAADIEKLREEYDGKLAEANENTKYWHEVATKEPKPAVAAGEADADEADDDLVQKMNDDEKGGGKALQAWLKRKGYIGAAEVDALVDAKARDLMTSARLQEAYPDLEDESSELFKQTAAEYRALEGTGVRKTARMGVAVERAELKLRRAGKWKDAADEEQRLTDIRAQDGSKGKRGAGASDSTVTLNPAQIAMAKANNLDPKKLLKHKMQIEQDRLEAT